MRWLKLTLAYDGTRYAGWQTQVDQTTLQGTLEVAVGRVCGERIRVAGSGRTDAGVHALGQVASFSTNSRLPADTLCRAFNAQLPHDMAVLSVDEVPHGFHARRDAVRKVYRYHIDNGAVPDLFARHYRWHVRGPLDADAMARAAGPLTGRHDFRSFEASGGRRRSSLRTVSRLDVTCRPKSGGHEICFDVQANGFLYNMVRNLVGTLVEVGRGRRSEAWPTEVLGAHDRRQAGPTAPPQGLFLVRVDYEP
ncbi:MAG: tRNA pseudouridine(38-40) synthase TruA [Pirellulales bacterium]